MKFLNRIKAIEKKLAPEDTGPPFPINIWRNGLLNGTEPMTFDEVEKMEKKKGFVLIIPQYFDVDGYGIG